jgi:serine protease Do
MVAMTWRNRTARLAMALVAMAAIGAIGACRPAVAATTGRCNVADIVTDALPAIVNITVVKVVTTGRENESLAADVDSKVARAPVPASPGGEPAGPHFETFVGSGAIVNPAGIIITNKHVIKDAAVIRVTLSDKTEVPAQLIAAASLVDLAMLKVNVPRPLPTLAFGNSAALRIGQRVIAVGNPLGLGTSVSVGVVSARGRDLMTSPFDDYIQTDATINPGNSGGPLLNCSGKIVGINTALLSNSKVLGSIGIGFALPANEAQFVASRLVNPQSTAPNWVGLHLQNLTARLATIFGRPDTSGAIVTGAVPGSPAAAAGIQPGDIVAGVDGQALDSASAVLSHIVTRPLTEPISLLIWRDRAMQEVVLRGEPWPDMTALRSNVLASAASVAEAQAAGLGLQLGPKTTAEDTHDGPVTGVLVAAVTHGSQADAIGLRPGDVIERVDGRPASDPAEIMHELARGAMDDGDLVALLVHGETSTRWVTLYVGRVYVSGLLATPALPGGFGAVGDAGPGIP